MSNSFSATRSRKTGSFLMKVLTKDNIEIELEYDNASPDELPGGMRSAMNYLWIKLPENSWKKCESRSSVLMKRIITKSTLEELKKTYV